MASCFEIAVDDGVAVIDWTGEDRSINLLDPVSLESLEAAIERIAGDEDIRAAVITSSRADLGGGADLQVVHDLAVKGEAAEFVQRMHRAFRRLETCGKPVIAACPGTAAGGTFELMLACHRRFLADRPGAKVGLPEVRVGLFPGAGGTTRLVRMMGLEKAGAILLKGRMLGPAEALEAGLVDELVAPNALQERAVAWARDASEADAMQPWDLPGYRLPGGGPYSAKGAPIFAGASAMLAARSRGCMPGAEAMLKAAYGGALVDFDTALRIEARHATALLANPRTPAAIRTGFLSVQELKRGAHRPAAVPTVPIARIGVVGAGMMGAGIALEAARAGIETVLLERDEGSLERGVDGLRKRAAAAAKEDAQRVLARIQPGTDFAPLGDCDIVIEAVYEDPAVKADVLARVAERNPPYIASNTSTLPISSLAEAIGDPARMLGIHFFSPVERMRLVEVIRGRETGDAAVGRALDLVAAIGKVPIVVRDARFFYANRCIIPYAMEAVGMVVEGLPPALIERAALAAGMPVGCLQLVDEISLGLNLQILEATRQQDPQAYIHEPAAEALQWMVQDQGRLGRTSGAGFYDYCDGRRVGLWPGLGERWPSKAADAADIRSVGERLLAIQAIEAVRVLEEGVLDDVREGDVGALLGWGFAPWSGGPFSYLDLMGMEEAMEMFGRLERDFGKRFAAPETLRRLAAGGGSFYGQREEGAEAPALAA